MPLPRYDHAAFVWSTAGYGAVLAVGGGYDGDNQMLSRLDVFDPQEQLWHRHLTWSHQPPDEAAPPLAGHAAIVHGNHTYFLGGQTELEDLTGQVQLVRTGRVFRRLVSAPLAVPNVIARNATILELAWAPPLAYAQSALSSEQLAGICPNANATSLIDTYELQLSDAGQWSTLYHGPRTSWTSSVLEPNTTYLFRARGGNALLGMIDWSISLEVTTLTELVQEPRLSSSEPDLYWVTVPVVAVIVLLVVAAYLCRRWNLMQAKQKRFYLLDERRRKQKGMSAALHLATGLKYHVFMSHTWSTGQSQVHNLVSRLEVLVPQLAIFLDVNCLEDASSESLRAHIAETAAILFCTTR